MRTIIAGSRWIIDYQQLEFAISSAGWEPTTVLSGCAKGPDLLGEVWANSHQIPLIRYPANWDEHGKYAGMLRNIQMAENAEALIALWDGESSGTSHMIETAYEHGLQVYVRKVKLVERFNPNEVWPQR
jgi:hypothetical protein